MAAVPAVRGGVTRHGAAEATSRDRHDFGEAARRDIDQPHPVLVAAPVLRGDQLPPVWRPGQRQIPGVHAEVADQPVGTAVTDVEQEDVVPVRIGHPGPVGREQQPLTRHVHAVEVEPEQPVAGAGGVDQVDRALPAHRIAQADGRAA
ncbi:hypothetical protein GCM10011608_45970 [Micromonospora sonchi]|uniref:Uncharacterized protein n=1 Tax=Micromonospora sonchi TaxID=1763543 RepID=A0A917X0Y9_9ACTN|nr:hypothetical protein GCM10011608_45970 [Micromonospora sonchi]